MEEESKLLKNMGLEGYNKEIILGHAYGEYQPLCLFWKQEDVVDRRGFEFVCLAWCGFNANGPDTVTPVDYESPWDDPNAEVEIELKGDARGEGIKDMYWGDPDNAGYSHYPDTKALLTLVQRLSALELEHCWNSDHDGARKHPTYAEYHASLKQS